MRNTWRRAAAAALVWLTLLGGAMGTGTGCRAEEAAAEQNAGTDETAAPLTEQSAGNGTAENGPDGELEERTVTTAQTAKELTGICRFRTNGSEKDYSLMTDGEVKTYFPFRENKKKKQGEVVITCEEPMGGLEIMAFDKFGRDHDYEIQIRDGEGWKTVDRGGTFLTHWHALPEPAGEIRVLATGTERLRIAEIRIFAPGEPPEDVQRWDTIEKCDLMLLTAHPDDEILWFAGLMPTYGGDRGYRIQVAVLVPTGGQRKLELLGAIWHCGVTHYPEFLGFIDKNGQSVEGQYQLWKGKNRVIKRVTEMIRKHRPEVLVTHGEKGEYGHGAHKAAADAARNAVKLSGDRKKYPESAEKWGTWEVKKLYLHEYEKDPIRCDWSQPLEAFDGKTGYEVAEEAFQFHGSQVRRDWNFEIHGAHDNAAFGLYYTAVGKDSGIGDLMEHIAVTAE